MYSVSTPPLPLHFNCAAAKGHVRSGYMSNYRYARLVMRSSGSTKASILIGHIHDHVTWRLSPIIRLLAKRSAP